MFCTSNTTVWPQFVYEVLFVYLFVYLFIYLFVYLFVCLHSFYLLATVCLWGSVCLFVYLFVCLFVCCLFVYTASTFWPHVDGPTAVSSNDVTVHHESNTRDIVRLGVILYWRNNENEQTPFFLLLLCHLIVLNTFYTTFHPSPPQEINKWSKLKPYRQWLNWIYRETTGTEWLALGLSWGLG